MKSLVVLSGKGGVGKSSIAASLAVVFSRHRRIVCADCDVDAPNLALLFSLGPEKFAEWEEISTNKAAEISQRLCSRCGECVSVCNFGALRMSEGFPVTDSDACEGCGACRLACPRSAIRLRDVRNAYLGQAATHYGFGIAFAQLMPGATGSGKIVSCVRKKAEEAGMGADLMIIDAAAGIGCPVIASLAGTDYAVVVAEPTPSSLADMTRALKLASRFKAKKGIVINKCTLSRDMCSRIAAFGRTNRIPVIGRIGFDRAFMEAQNKMVPVAEHSKMFADTFEGIMRRVVSSLG